MEAELEQGKYTLEEIVKKDELSSSWGEYQGDLLLVKKGKFGWYASWGDQTKSLKGLPPDDFTREDIIAILENEETNVVRILTDVASIRKSKRGDYLFYKTKKMKKPQFFSLKDYPGDYKVDPLHTWIQSQHGIDIAIS